MSKTAKLICGILAALFLIHVVVPLAVSLIFNYNWSVYGKIKHYDDDTRDLEDNGTRYVYSGDFQWDCDTYDLSEIGWIWMIPLLGSLNYYAETENSPDYIYCSRSYDLWFREGIDLDRETFIVENTAVGGAFSDIFDDRIVEHELWSEDPAAEFNLRLKSYEKLGMYVRIYKKKGAYFISIPDGTSNYYLVRDGFLTLLKQNGVIE